MSRPADCHGAAALASLPKPEDDKKGVHSMKRFLPVVTAEEIMRRAGC
jgi:hypothetical protein